MSERVMYLSLEPADVVALQATGTDPRDVEIEALRRSQDELADENAELRLLLEIHGIEVPEGEEEGR